MYIREWFGGSEKSINELNQTEVCFDGLLSRYSVAVSKYLNGDYYSAGIINLVKEARNKKLGIEEEMFLDWLEEEGIPTIIRLMSQELPDDDQLRAQIEYEKFMLEKEIGYDDPEELSSLLIDIMVTLPDRVKEANTERVAIDKYTPWDYIMADHNYPGNIELDIEIFKKENGHNLSNKKGSASIAGPFSIVEKTLKGSEDANDIRLL
jgi:hypothetical protein